MSLGPITHHLMKARELLHAIVPVSALEESLLKLVKLHLDSALHFIRRVHHKKHVWRNDGIQRDSLGKEDENGD